MIRFASRELQRRVFGARRFARDVASGVRQKLVPPLSEAERGRMGLRTRIVVEQRAGGTAHAEAKRHNIALVARTISRAVIAPGGVFSFWHLVGRPSARRGFVPGRSLVEGRVELDYGGGLCQLSGALYHVALLGGLYIIERHPHTLDIYTEEARYAPLGADAAVAFGFKDLRVANPFPFPVAFSVELRGELLRCGLDAPQPVAEHALRFDREEHDDGTRTIDLYRTSGDDGVWEHLNRSRYIVAA